MDRVYKNYNEQPGVEEMSNFVADAVHGLNADCEAPVLATRRGGSCGGRRGSDGGGSAPGAAEMALLELRRRRPRALPASPAGAA
jgi:hypothetical protein